MPYISPMNKRATKSGNLFRIHPYYIVLFLTFHIHHFQTRLYGNPNKEAAAWKVLSDKAWKSGNIRRALDCLDSALNRTQNAGPSEKSRILLKKALIYQIQAEYGEALFILFEARRNFLKAGDAPGLGEVSTNIGAIFQNLGDYPKAEGYYRESLKIYLKLGRWKELARCYNNFGSLAEDMNQPDKALSFHRKCMALWKQNGEKGWEGISYMHLGISHDLKGNQDSALYYLKASAKNLELLGDQRTEALVYSHLGNIWRKRGQMINAKEWCQKGLELAEKSQQIRYEVKCSECLSKVYESMGNPAKAFAFHKRFIALRDSVYNEQKAKEITRLEMNFNFQQRRYADSLKQSKIRHLEDLKFEKRLSGEKEKRNISIFSGILVFLFAGGLWNRLLLLRRSKKQLSDEKDRSENLLLKVLPAEIVEELKSKGKTEGREHENISVLFLDVKSFTLIAQQLEPRELVEEIHTCFGYFDFVVESFGLEKIKTIGDSYMAAAGVPLPVENGAEQSILAALAIQDFLSKRKTEREKEGKPAFEMRAGIHSGSVVAGVVGENKFQYDIWGDTVNTASRMESLGEAGKVNISRATYEQVKECSGLKFESRGAIEVKGKGRMEMYFVSRSFPID